METEEDITPTDPWGGASVLAVRCVSAEHVLIRKQLRRTVWALACLTIACALQTFLLYLVVARLSLMEELLRKTCP